MSFSDCIKKDKIWFHTSCNILTLLPGSIKNPRGSPEVAEPRNAENQDGAFTVHRQDTYKP